MTRSTLDPAWRGRRVFVTGHMGFKGAWLCFLLDALGSRITGYGIDRRERLLFRSLSLGGLEGHEGDILDLAAMTAAMRASEAEVVLHLAAQPLVRASYADPVGTIATNVVGTANVLEAARQCPSVRAVVVVTSDKVYQPTSPPVAHREGDRLGGRDPYSASKAAAEIITASMAHASFAGEGSARVATARAGNVIGGGDWAADRLLPDAARAFEAGAPVEVRNPQATRPWQHVLEPLHGYLLLAEALLERRVGSPSSFNFGPTPTDVLTVGSVLDTFCAAWLGHPGWSAVGNAGQPAESKFLAIDSTLAQETLGWRPVWPARQAIERTAAFYAAVAAGADCSTLMKYDLEQFRADQAVGAH